MSLNSFEQRAYDLAEASATGVCSPGKPIPCDDCRGAGMRPSADALQDKDTHFVAIRLGVVYCTACDGTGEAKLTPEERTKRWYGV